MNNIEWTGRTWFLPEARGIPLKTKKPTTWFVGSMSDLFHESVTFDQLCKTFDVMGSTPRHTYQILTKRPQRMAEMVPLIYRELAAREGLDLPEDAEPPSNIWLGCTVENQATADERIPLLLQTPAAVRFLSCEPLLEEVSIDCIEYTHDWGKGHIESFACWNPLGVSGVDPYHTGISWVIVGGESGPGARPCEIAWIRSIVEQCKAAGVACFFKQWGRNDPSEWPEDLRVRQMPSVGK